jgi:hypothetical protein
MMQKKVVVKNRVEKDKSNHKKFMIKAHKSSEFDLTIEITGDGDYEVEKLSIEDLPATMTDGKSVRWLNNFSVKKNGQYINEQFFVTIPDIEKSQLVIYDGNGNPYYYTGEIKNNTFELTDGDPAVGRIP